ncbi:class I SAM-dependent methyltransferase [Oleiagrimonas sp. C23AA]|uniref:methyltransferase domain-containing protein n=1 Tax=Oleiagrimonas sp. C23AA TaxID=2719047 RepID=UPI001423D79E|nr:class I SAM-dependent methyltransferase [Oleiagrimonas sp. C23AA]NII11441.1 class I SAM-dependent methyltransferase [Oleiagrimonas sp. C23AA]
MTSYRKSHIGAGVGERYDAKHAIRVDALIWNDFVKPQVRKEFEHAASEGAASYLDFACGTGRLLKLGHTVFGESVGIDISENMLMVAQRRVPDAQLKCVDVTRSPPSDIGCFDCVSMFRFILNAEPELRRDALKWIADHMNRGATLIVNNHRNSASISGFFSRLAFWLPKDAKNILSRREMVEILRVAGFSLVRCEGFRILPSIFGRPLFGRKLQVRGERLCRRMGLGRFGAELVMVAMRD